MADWHPECYQRATAYVTDRRGRLLVFEHVDVPTAGTQVPAGGILPGETPAEAVARELAEESGIESASLVRKLGETWCMAEPGQVPVGLEQQVQHAFHLDLHDPAPPEAWAWEERSGGEEIEHRFAFRWVSLDDAATLLWPVQAMWINAVRQSLANR